MRRRFLGCVLAAFGVAVALASAQAGTRITISSWVSPKHPVNYGGYVPFIEAVERASGGEISFRLFTGGALLSAKTTLAGIADGIADVGVIALTYHPAEFPHAQLIADTALLSRNPAATAAAVTEFNLLHCRACLDEFSAQGLVYTGTYSTAHYALIGNTAIVALSDLEGLRIRSPGSVWDRWVRHVGAVPVNLPASDMYESLERGITDAVLQPVAALRSYSLWDVADHVTLLNLGTYHSLSLLGYGKPFWRGITAAERKLLLDNAPVALIGTSLAYVELDEEVLSESDSRRIEIIAASDELVRDRHAFAESDLAEVVEFARRQHGIAEPEPMIASLRALFAKWEEIMAPIGDDRAAMAAALKAEVFDRLDPSYGL